MWLPLVTRLAPSWWTNSLPYLLQYIFCNWLRRCRDSIFRGSSQSRCQRWLYILWCDIFKVLPTEVITTSYFFKLPNTIDGPLSIDVWKIVTHKTLCVVWSTRLRILTYRRCKWQRQLHWLMTTFLGLRSHRLLINMQLESVQFAIGNMYMYVFEIGQIVFKTTLRVFCLFKKYPMALLL